MFCLQSYWDLPFRIVLMYTSDLAQVVAQKISKHGVYKLMFNE